MKPEKETGYDAKLRNQPLLSAIVSEQARIIYVKNLTRSLDSGKNPETASRHWAALQEKKKEQENYVLVNSFTHATEKRAESRLVSNEITEIELHQ